MIDLKTAIHTAQNYLSFIQDMLGDFENLRLEEVELSEDNKYWLITLGYDIPRKSQNPLIAIAGLTPQEGKILTREYKIFKVNSETGKVEAMKIRKL